MVNIFGKLPLVTLVRYGLAIVGAVLTTAGIIDEETWVAVGGALLAIITALLGAVDASKKKVNIGGKSVAVENLPTDLQTRLEAIVPVRKARGIFDIFLGK